MKMKRGYIYVLLFSIFIAIAQAIKNSSFQEIDGVWRVSRNTYIKAAILFVIFFVPGVFLVRWYYSIKKNNP